VLNDNSCTRNVICRFKLNQVTSCSQIFEVALNMSNELFFTDKEPYFERNRIMGGFTIQVTKSSSFQLAYLHQFDYKINDEIGRDFFVIGYYFEIKRSNNVDESQKD
jgi:hypothetical protein